MKQFFGLFFAGVLASSGAHAQTFTLDWETDALGNTIQAGQVIDNEYAAWGIDVTASNPNRSFDLAITFDSENPTGGDADLGTGAAGYHPTNNQALGNVLILAERNYDGNGDGLIDTPDDEGRRPGGYIDFDFTFDAFGGEITILDIDDPSHSIDFYLNGVLLGGESLVPAGIGDNSMQTLTFGGFSFDQIRYNFGGSGAIGELVVDSTPIPEPSTVLLLGSASTIIASARRRKEARDSQNTAS